MCAVLEHKLCKLSVRILYEYTPGKILLYSRDEVSEPFVLGGACTDTKHLLLFRLVRTGIASIPPGRPRAFSVHSCRRQTRQASSEMRRSCCSRVSARQAPPRRKRRKLQLGSACGRMLRMVGERESHRGARHGPLTAASTRGDHTRMQRFLSD